MNTIVHRSKLNFKLQSAGAIDDSSNLIILLLKCIGAVSAGYPIFHKEIKENTNKSSSWRHGRALQSDILLSGER